MTDISLSLKQSLPAIAAFDRRGRAAASLFAVSPSYFTRSRPDFRGNENSRRPGASSEGVARAANFHWVSAFVAIL
jgi:hypothetical protein